MKQVRPGYLMAIFLVLGFMATVQSAFGQQWRLEDITPLDRQYIDQQHERIDDLARINLGAQLKGDRSHDLRLMQRLLDQDLITKEDTVTLQAIGIVMGALLKKEYGLNWVVYTDAVGRSRALQVPGINEFVFPATQVSRRVEVGLKVSITKVYQELQQSIIEIKKKPILFQGNERENTI